MKFASDNRAGVSPEILDALAREAGGFGGAYGEDDATDRLDASFSEIFERAVTVFPVATGTAANSLALASSCDPWGAVICHAEAHIAVDECSAPEFFGGGLRLAPLPGDGGRLQLATVREVLDAAAADRNDVHRTPFQALSLTNLAELGRAYRAAETAALADVAKQHGLTVHLDGARFANAVVGTGSSPAELTWRAGVDVMSFGATKNGALAAEAVVFFEPGLAATFERRRKRSGHLLSKMRFVSVQLEASLAEGRWLTTATHANDMAARLAAGLTGAPGVTVLPFDGNELFVITDSAAVAGWREAGAEFYDAAAPPDQQGAARRLVRLVTSFATTDEHVAALLEVINSHASRRSTGANS
ncbi:MAG TPA: beta-eliminating lyase-related protein [Microthrixaceae bacterium]|nr:beta-eliminating lyase-related protein [Microthrixaceae bacterium]